MKKILILLLAIVLIASMGFAGISCKAEEAVEEVVEEAVEEEVAEEEAPAEEAVKEYYIVWDIDNLDESNSLTDGAVRKRIDEINTERDDIHITYESTDAQNIVERQLSSMEQWLLKKPDAVLFSYVDSDALKGSVKALRDAGIPVFDLRDMGDIDIVDMRLVGYHEPTYTEKTTAWLEKYLQDNPDVVLETLLLYGAAVQVPQLQRCDLVKDLAEKYPGRINILAEAHGDWDTAKSMNIAEDWIQAYSNFNYICCGNSGMATGVGNALIGANRTEDVLITSIDFTDSGVQMLYDGIIDLLVGSTSGDMGVFNIEQALAYLEGTIEYTSEKTATFKGVYSVDTTNMEDFLKNDFEGTQPTK